MTFWYFLRLEIHQLTFSNLTFCFQTSPNKLLVTTLLVKFCQRKKLQTLQVSHLPIVDKFLKLSTTLIHLVQFLEDLFVLFSIGEISTAPRCCEKQCLGKVSPLFWHEMFPRVCQFGMVCVEMLSWWLFCGRFVILWADSWTEPRFRWLFEIEKSPRSITTNNLRAISEQRRWRNGKHKQKAFLSSINCFIA